MANFEEIADQLWLAEQERAPFAPLTETYPKLTATDAYHIQNALLAKRLTGGAQLVGRKVGLTSKAMQVQLGVDEPDFGFLLDVMLVPAGAALNRNDFIQPRLEPEIAFWLAEDLTGPDVTAEQVLASTRGVSAAMELVDSRIKDWKIKLVDTIADNGSSSRAVISNKIVPLDKLDLADEAVSLTCNGDEVGKGNGAAVLGHPAAAVAWLANALAAFGTGLKAGQVVLPGAMCASVFAHAGNSYRASFTNLGEVSVKFS